MKLNAALLSRLFDGVDSGYVEFRALPSKERVFAPCQGNVLAVARDFALRHKDQHCYVGMATRLRTGDGTRQNCHLVGALWADLDQKLLPAVDLDQRLAAFALAPSIIVHSGGGRHAYWLLKEPIDLATADPDPYLQRLALALDSDPKVAQAAAVMRMPGTLNPKYTPIPRVHVLSVEDREYTLSDFDEVLPALEVQAPHGHEPGRPFSVPPEIKDGERNELLYTTGRSLKAKGLTVTEIRAALHVVNRERCRPPLPAAEVDDIADHADRQPNRASFTATEPPPAARPVYTASAESLTLSWPPPPGFFTRFDHLVEPLTDAPTCYRPYAALACLSAVAGRNVVARVGVQPVAPNLYTLILGDSSTMRKTTVCNVVESLVDEVLDDRRLYPNETTPERLLKILQETPCGLFIWREFTGFVASANRDYSRGLRELLMEVYDGPKRYRRDLQSGTITIERPTVSVFTASATPWLADLLKGGDLKSGFLNRFAIVLALRKDRHLDLPSPPDPALHHALVRDLKQIATIRGEADFSQVRPAYAAWLRDLERQIERHPHVTVISGFYTRLSVKLLKYALLIEMATSGSLTVSADSLDAARVLIEFNKRSLAYLLRHELAETESGKRLQRVLKVITGRPGRLRKELLQTTGYTADELRPLLDTLRQRGDIVEQDAKWYPAEAPSGVDAGR